jgi:hypothetical protein
MYWNRSCSSPASSDVAEGVGDTQEQVVEIQGVVGRQELLVLRVDARDRARVEIRGLLSETSGVTSWFLALLIVA